MPITNKNDGKKIAMRQIAAPNTPLGANLEIAPRYAAKENNGPTRRVWCYSPFKKHSF